MNNRNEQKQAKASSVTFTNEPEKGPITRICGAFKHCRDDPSQGGWTIVELMVVLFVAGIASVIALTYVSHTVTRARASSLIRGVHNAVAKTRSQAIARQKHVALKLQPDSASSSDTMVQEVTSGWGTDFIVYSPAGATDDMVYFVYKDRRTGDGDPYYTMVLDNGGQDVVYFGPRGLAWTQQASGTYKHVTNCEINIAGHAYGLSSGGSIKMEITPLGKIKMDGS